MAGFSEEGVACARNLRVLTGALARYKTPWETLAAYLFEHAVWLRVLLKDETPAAHRELATLGQVANLAREFGTRTALAGGSDTNAFLAFLRTCLESGELGFPNELLVADDVVHVLTAHRSKGLEWPVVVVPNLAIGRFPLKEHDPLPLPPGLIRGATAEDEAIEERCLFYVAMTRARDRLILSRSEKYGRGSAEPAPFLQPVIDALKAAGGLRIYQAASATLSSESALTSATVPWSFEDEIPFRALSDYEQCGQQFKYDQVYRLRGAERGSLMFYRAVYATLSWMAHQASAGAPADASSAVAHLAGHWEESGLEEHWYGAGYRRRAERIVRAFVARFEPGRQISIRRQAQLLVGEHNRPVELTIDEEEVRDSIRIYRRYDFGNPGRTHDDRDHRPALLAALHRQDHGDEAAYEIRLYNPLSGQDEVLVPRSAKVIANRITKMQVFIEGIEAGQFEPKPNVERCSICPFNLICPA